MVKKILALMMVFGIASVANAGLQISVNGNQDPIDSEITLLPSEELVLDIWIDAPIDPFTGYTWAIVADTSLATISGGVPVSQSVAVNQVNGPTQEAAAVIPPEGHEGIWGSMFNVDSSPHGTPGETMVDEIILHCEAKGDVTVGLWENIPDGEPFGWDTVTDTVTIHQVPEPATIALLGLGGLFLVRRRR